MSSFVTNWQTAFKLLEREKPLFWRIRKYIIKLEIISVNILSKSTKKYASLIFFLMFEGDIVLDQCYPSYKISLAQYVGKNTNQKEDT